MVVGRRFQHDGRVVNPQARGITHCVWRRGSLRLLVVWLSLLVEPQMGTIVFLLLFVRQEFDGFGLPFLCLLEVGNCSVVLLSWSRNRDNEGVWLVFAMYQDS